MKKTLILAVMISLCTCKKEQGNGIPLVPVDIVLYTSDPIFFNLQVPGGWEYVSGGSRGLLIYRRSYDEFVAFDRHCTYQPDNVCGRVQVDSTNIRAVDTCCGSIFHIYDGSVLNGPAGFALQQYQTTFDGSALHIFN